VKAPRLEIDLKRLRHNARRVKAICRSAGIEVTGITKAAHAHPQIARAMLSAGLRGLGDSRLENLKVLRDRLGQVELMLIRLPMLSEVEEVVRYCDISLNSEEETLKALDRAAARLGRVHEVILMVDLGDLREGVWPDRLPSLARGAARLEHLRVVGLATNLACYAGVIPSCRNMEQLVEATRVVEEAIGRQLGIVSGGNSANIPLVLAGGMPGRVNHLRIGEAILLGRETTQRNVLPGAYTDAITVVAEVIEVQDKPSVPVGDLGQDAFGRMPEFEDRGTRRRAVLAIGRQDTVPEGLTPLEPGIQPLGGSSDHILLDIQDAEREVKVGDELRFVPNYAALLQSFTSPYVAEAVVEDGR